MEDRLQWKAGNQPGSHFKTLCEGFSGKSGKKKKKKWDIFWMPNYGGLDVG